jgi:hypothetical protein
MFDSNRAGIFQEAGADRDTGWKCPQEDKEEETPGSRSLSTALKFRLIPSAVDLEPYERVLPRSASAPGV